MKTLKVKINQRDAVKAGILFFSLDMPILMNWSEEGLMGDITIYLLLKLDQPGNFPESLRMEKIKEAGYVKLIN